MKIKLTILIIVLGFVIEANAQEVSLKHRSISECLTNCSIKSEVISATLTERKLALKLGLHLNCGVSTSKSNNISYTLQNDTLNVIIYALQRDTITTETDSSKTTVIVGRETACRCFFHIELEFENMVQPKTYLINGQTLEDNYQSRTIEEKRE